MTAAVGSGVERRGLLNRQNYVPSSEQINCCVLPGRVVAWKVGERPNQYTQSTRMGFVVLFYGRSRWLRDAMTTVQSRGQPGPDVGSSTEEEIC